MVPDALRFSAFIDRAPEDKIGPNLEDFNFIWQLDSVGFGALKAHANNFGVAIAVRRRYRLCNPATNDEQRTEHRQ